MADVSAAASAASTAAPPPQTGRAAWKDPSGFGFHDFLDIINPLQHLPIISSIYRWVTGDRPGEAAEIAGDALYGGPIGVGLGLIGAAFEDKSGRDLGEQTLTALFGSDDTTVKVASAAAPSPPAAATTEPVSAPVSLLPATAPTVKPDHLAQTPSGGEAVPFRTAEAPGIPDHPPMPLYHRATQPPAASAPTPSAASQFLAHNAVLQRQVGNGPPIQLNNKPVPLNLPSGVLPAAHTAPPLPVTARPGEPIDISKRMLDALDKYMKLEQERKKSAPAPAVDLTM